MARLGADEAGDVKACLVLSVLSVILYPALWSAAWSRARTGDLSSADTSPD